MVTAGEAASIRVGMQQPTGVAARRAIAADVVKNITTMAPRCASQKIISQDALAYLLGWVNHSLPKLARPKAYSCLRFRQRSPCSFLSGVAVVPKWEVHSGLGQSEATG